MAQTRSDRRYSVGFLFDEILLFIFGRVDNEPIEYGCMNPSDILKNKRFVVYGAPASGKTTLMKLLRDTHKLPETDLDDEILIQNEGIWPEDSTYRNREIVPLALERVAKSEVLHFFTSGMNELFAQNLHASGATIFLLKLDEESLQTRNQKRMREEGIGDVTVEFQKNLVSQERYASIIDCALDATKAPEEILQDMCRYFLQK